MKKKKTIIELLMIKDETILFSIKSPFKKTYIEKKINNLYINESILSKKFKFLKIKKYLMTLSIEITSNSKKGLIKKLRRISNKLKKENTKKIKIQKEGKYASFFNQEKINIPFPVKKLFPVDKTKEFKCS